MECTWPAVPEAAGFGEVGAAGRAGQDDLVRLARAHGIRLLGPSCLGIINIDPIPCERSAMPPATPPGDANRSVADRSWPASTPAGAREVVRAALAAGAGWQPYDHTAALFSCYGVPLHPSSTCRYEQTAMAAAEAIGYRRAVP